MLRRIYNHTSSHRVRTKVVRANRHDLVLPNDNRNMLLRPRNLQRHRKSDIFHFVDGSKIHNMLKSE